MLCLCLAEAALGFAYFGPPPLRWMESPIAAQPSARFEDPPPPPPAFPAALAAAASGLPRVGHLAMAVAAPPPRTRPKSTSTAVTRRGGGQLISWYFKSISSTRLLTAQQEQQLARMIIAGEEYENAREELCEGHDLLRTRRGVSARGCTHLWGGGG